MFYLFIFSWFKKEDSIQFFIVFGNHLRESSFWNFSELFICYSFMILSKIYKTNKPQNPVRRESFESIEYLSCRVLKMIVNNILSIIISRIHFTKRPFRI